MSRKRIVPLALLLGWVFVGQAKAGEAAARGQDELSASIRQLRQLVEQLATHVRALEERVGNLERLLAARDSSSTQTPVSVRPVGRFFVDQHGVILDARSRSVGVWGVNGQHMVPKSQTR